MEAMNLENPAIVVSHCGIITNILKYKAVYEIRNAVSSFVSKYIVHRHQCVGLKMSHNIYIPSIILSLQELGHAFIFLPTEKHANKPMMDALEIGWVLTFDSTSCVGTLPLNLENLCLEHCANVSKSYENIYYIIGTSGTTGQSKFVYVGKHSINSNVISLSNRFNITTDDVIYFGTPLTFDPSMVELLLALSNGACLLITSPTMKGNYSFLYDTLFHSKNGVTVFQTVPSLFLRWSGQQIKSILMNPVLRILAFGGESFPGSIISYKRSGSLRMFNLYGITEISCWATAHEVQPLEIKVPIGRELDDTVVEVRDESGLKIDEGEGEIYIGSKSRCCFVDEELLERDCEIFRATGDIGNICNQEIFYVGRKNDVFKRFGHKLHLSKIEQLIEKATELQNRCVWSRSQSKLLVFMIIEDYDVNVKFKILDKLRIKLLHSLPEHCSPDYIDIIKKYPVTSHGKTDKHVLEEIYLNSRQINEVDGVECFKCLLHKYFGLNEEELTGLLQSTFFEIGGNSIIAVQLLTELKDELGVDDCSELVVALFEKKLEECLCCLRSIKVTNPKRSLTESIEDHSAPKKVKSCIQMGIAWSYDLRACVDATPLVFSYTDKILVAVGSFSHIFCVLDGSSGREVSKYVLPDTIESSPCVSSCGAYLYVGCFDGKMYCLDFMSGHIKWTYGTNDRIKCTPVLCRQSSALVFGSYDKYVHCINILDGTLIWKTNTSSGVTSTPLLHDFHIYIATISGACFCLTESNGDVLWWHRSGGPIFGAPCLSNNRIVWPNVEGSLICLTTSGQQCWQYKAGGHLYASLLAYDDLIIFGCHDRKLYVIQDDGDVPTLRVAVHLDDNVSSKVAVCKVDSEAYILVAGVSGHLKMIDFKGDVLAEMSLGNQVFSSIAVCRRQIYVGCRDNNLYCIDIKN